MTASEHTELLPALLAWLKKRGEPDSGIDYRGREWNDWDGARPARVVLHATDADFVVKHFHGQGARDLAAALEAAIAALLDGAEPVPVAWHDVGYLMSVIDAAIEDGFDPDQDGPLLDEIRAQVNCGIFASPTGMMVERAATELARHDLAHMFPDRDNLPMDQVLPLIAMLREPARLALIAALHPTSETTEEPEKCFICLEPFKAGEMVLHDVNEGLGHRACFGEDRAAYVKDIDTGEPLGPDDPIPEGWPYLTPVASEKGR